ncbi:hypothetical protein [Rhodococcus sp. MEB064]|uniref:hypothetical protein n=1 Tax=Rhodococcus sp. MEB064 TaxID=1587522 RepID=UPI0005ABF471|nr:hypothetical protein [Rhodococcus sp. MEB064]KIQ07988.1 hypothetical protein RU01_21415 [Rhodococcus sp. MEB064]
MHAARAYCDAWGATVRYIENSGGDIVPRAEWELLCIVGAPLPYIYTVELRSPISTAGDELITALWTTTEHCTPIWVGTPASRNTPTTRRTDPLPGT